MKFVLGNCRSEGYRKGNGKEWQDVEMLFSAVIFVISNLATNLDGNVSKLCMLLLIPSVLKLEFLCRRGRRSATYDSYLLCFIVLLMNTHFVRRIKTEHDTFFH